MHAENLRQLLQATPFIPFTVHLVSDQSYLVDHPDFATLTRGGRTLIVNVPGGQGEKVNLLDTALIERADKTMEAAAD